VTRGRDLLVSSGRQPSWRRVHTEPRPYGNVGSATVELVILTPVVMLFVLFVAAIGRFEIVRSQVTGVARDAAEAAAVAPDALAALQAASAAAPPVVVSGSACRHLIVDTDLGAFRPGGSVTVTVRCTVPFADLAVPGLPGSAPVSSTVVAPIDTFRGVG